MYHPSDLAAMDPLVLMKNLDHVRMTSRRLSYVLQQQCHLYTPEANDLREQIDRYVEAERQIEGEMAQAPHPRLTACRAPQQTEDPRRSGRGSSPFSPHTRREVRLPAVGDGGSSGARRGGHQPGRLIGRRDVDGRARRSRIRRRGVSAPSASSTSAA